MPSDVPLVLLGAVQHVGVEEDGITRRQLGVQQWKALFEQRHSRRVSAHLSTSCDVRDATSRVRTRQQLNEEDNMCRGPASRRMPLLFLLRFLDYFWWSICGYRVRTPRKQQTLPQF